MANMQAKTSSQQVGSDPPSAGAPMVGGCLLPSDISHDGQEGSRQVSVLPKLQRSYPVNGQVVNVAVSLGL